MKPYERKNIPLAKSMRKEMTPWERKIWYTFLKTYPIRFQRQKAIGNYIVDFYAAKARLAVEIDGSGHYSEEQLESDKRRTADLEVMGIKILRFNNQDVDRRFSDVCEQIDQTVKNSLR